MGKTELYRLGYVPNDIQPKPIHPIVPHNLTELFRAIYGAKDSLHKVVILWDTDVDGLFAGYISYNILIKIIDKHLISNYINETKIHGITDKFIKHCITNDIKTVIVVDAGTNDVEEIKELNRLGITVIVIDHHEKTEEYFNENFILINSNDMSVGQKVSGAYLTNEVMKRLFENTYKNTLTDYDELAIISIVADICERDEYNKNVILNFIFGKCRQTDLINLFRNKYTINSVPFIISLSSKINAILRYLGTRKTMDLILNNHHQLKEWILDSNSIKGLNKRVMNDIIQLSTIYEMDNLVIVIITKETGMVGVMVRNYLGIIASKVSRMKGKLCLVLANREVNFEVVNKDYKFCYSVRDVKNRDSLQTAIECGLDANGHPKAWGGYLGDNYAKLLNELNNSLTGAKELEVKNKIYKAPNIEKELMELDEMILPLSLWNTIQAEEDKIKFEFELDGTITKNGVIKKIKLNSIEFKSFEDNIFIGEKVYCIPEYNRTVDLLIKK